MSRVSADLADEHWNADLLGHLLAALLWHLLASLPGYVDTLLFWHLRIEKKLRLQRYKTIQQKCSELKTHQKQRGNVNGTTNEVAK